MATFLGFLMIFILIWIVHGLFSPGTTWGESFHKGSRLRIVGMGVAGFFALIIVMGAIVGAPENEASSKTDTKQQGSLVEYSILDETVDETPGATKVFLDLLVSEEISEAELRNLLEYLYREAKQRSGFKYHEHPTIIAIYAYPSREHAESGMGQWLGMLSKAPMNDKPNINLHASVGKPDAFPKERFGFSEERRKEIYKDLIRTEDRAQAEAERRYPTPSDLSGFQKQSDLQSELVEQYDSELAEKLGLSREQLQEIANEGLQKNWPMPEMD